MAVAKIPCPHCQRNITLDTDKVPDKKFSFKCPACKGKVSIDPAKLGTTAGDAPAEAKAGAEVAADEHVENGNGAETVLDLPPGASLPNALMVGDNPETINSLKAILEEHGSTVDVLEDPSTLAGIVPEEVPPLLVFVGTTAGPPPWAAARPVTSLPPRVRQRTFVVLVADDLVTLDGGKAFFYQANLLLNPGDMERAAAIIYSALQFHKRLYGPLLSALEQRETRAVHGE